MKHSKALVSVVLIAVLVLLVAALAGCGSTTTATTAAPATTTTGGTATTATTAPASTTTAAAPVSIKIGIIAPITGQLAKFGIDTVNAVSLAVDDAKKNGVIPANVTVTVEQGDDAADPAKAATLAQKFIDETEMVGIIGPLNSSSAQSALPILDKGNLLMISPSTTNTKLAQQGFKTFFRVCPIDDAQGAALADVMVNTVKAKKVYMIDDKSTYGQGLADQVEASLKQLGVTDIQRAQITPDDKDFSALITKIKAFAPDCFFAAIPSPSQYAAIAKQMAQANYKVQLIGADGTRDVTEFITNAAGATEGAICTTLGPLLDKMTDPATVAFVKEYKDKGWELSLFSGQSYEATNVLLQAIKAAAATGTVDRASVMTAVRATNYTGVLGIPIQFTPEGNMVKSGLYLIQVKGADFVQLKAL
jgi:branched-chain amino acid transport system substrate-binding protein